MNDGEIALYAHHNEFIQLTEDSMRFSEAMYLISQFLKVHGFLFVQVETMGIRFRLIRDDHKPIAECTEIAAGTFSQVFAKVLEMIDKGELHE